MVRATIRAVPFFFYVWGTRTLRAANRRDIINRRRRPFEQNDIDREKSIFFSSNLNHSGLYYISQARSRKKKNPLFSIIHYERLISIYRV